MVCKEIIGARSIPRDAFLVKVKNQEKQNKITFNPIQDGLSWGCSQMGVGKKAALLKICHTYPTMMKIGTVISYLIKIQKICESCNTALEFCWHQHSSPGISKFCYIKKYRYRLQFDTWFLILLTFLESINIVLINMVTILMMSVKMANPGLLKIKVFFESFWRHNFCPWHHQQNFIT